MIAWSVLNDRAAAGEVEARIRGLVAEYLGVDAEQIAREVSLVEDLAADSLDLVEIGLAIEGNLGVVLPQHFLDQVRTCGELIDATVALASRRGRTRGSRDDFPVALRARITPPGLQPAWAVERVLLLTPYAAETLSQDALRAGPGARLELTLGAEVSDGAFARVQGQFSRLGERGIAIDVRRDRRAYGPAAA